MNTIDDITGLDITRWERAHKLAQDQIRNMVPKPVAENYSPRGFGRFPTWVTAGMFIMLFVIATAAFWISAGKQIAATDLVLMPVVENYHRLSATWADIGIMLNLLLGELGTILFFTAAGIFPGAAVEVRRFRFQPFALAFMLAGVMCACFAILANITITALHPISEVGAYSWFLTLAAPFIVLFIGLFAERLLMVTLEARAEAREAYNKDYDLYDQTQRDPELHPDFKRLWHLAVLDQLMKISAANRKKIEDAQHLRAELVKREFMRHEWASFTLEAAPTYPTLPPIVGA